VVVVEDILKHKAILKAGTDPAAMAVSLDALASWNIPINTLTDTKVGAHVRRLVSHSDEAVRSRSLVCFQQAYPHNVYCHSHMLLF